MSISTEQLIREAYRPPRHMQDRASEASVHQELLDRARRLCETIADRLAHENTTFVVELAGTIADLAVAAGVVNRRLHST